MAVTITKPVNQSGFWWKIVVSSDLGGTTTFFWRRNGARYSEGTDTQQIVHIDPTESPVFWISDISFGNDEDFLAGNAKIQIFIDEDSTPAYEFIRFEEFVSAVWTLRKKVLTDGAGYYDFTSRFLEDETTHQFRAVPVGVNGNEGTPTTLSIFMVRNPDIPDVGFVYNGSGPATVTITEN